MQKLVFPRYAITSEIDIISKEMVRVLSEIDDAGPTEGEMFLRKMSRIRSINSSLAIEGNVLDLEKTRDVINGKTVEGCFVDILETKNAINAYRNVEIADLCSIEDFIRIHDDMTFGLIEEPGFRTMAVNVYEGSEIIYKAPDADDVPGLMEELFEWSRNTDLPPFISACIIHYQIESIHPFEDGNGRMGRLWHTDILNRYNRIFRMIPLESRIHDCQDEYYRVLETCQNKKDCTDFIEFSLRLTLESLVNLSHIRDPDVSRLLKCMGDGAMTSSAIMKRMRLKDKQHFLSKYMRPAIEYGLVSMTEPESPRSPTQKYRRTIRRTGPLRMSRPIQVPSDFKWPRNAFHAEVP